VDDRHVGREARQERRLLHGRVAAAHDDEVPPAEERAGNPNGSNELAALLSPRVRRAIEKRGFRLDKSAAA
jgi:pyruvate/2-oxoglutarate dehydrogenase complex dihydrolipoamide acyltransferase (E2) component